VLVPPGQRRSKRKDALKHNQAFGRREYWRAAGWPGQSHMTPGRKKRGRGEEGSTLKLNTQLRERRDRPAQPAERGIFVDGKQKDREKKSLHEFCCYKHVVKKEGGA